MSKSSVSQWGTTADNNLDVGGISLAEGVMSPPAVNNAIREMMAQIKDLYVSLSHQGAGKIDWFDSSAVPDGWLAADGQTIGNGSSGATSRANADCKTLFSIIWNSYSNTARPIQDSNGSATIRGASATADFSANKRLPLPDLRGEFVRGLDRGRGVDNSRTLGSAQTDAFKSHTHTATVSDPGHHHTIGVVRQGGPGFGTGGPYPPNVNANTSDATTGITVSNASTGDSETRPRNIALYACIKY